MRQEVLEGVLMMWDLDGPTAEKKLLCHLCAWVVEGCDYRLMKAVLEMVVGRI